MFDWQLFLPPLVVIVSMALLIRLFRNRRKNISSDVLYEERRGDMRVMRASKGLEEKREGENWIDATERFAIRVFKKGESVVMEVLKRVQSRKKSVIFRKEVQKKSFPFSLEGDDSEQTSQKKQKNSEKDESFPEYPKSTNRLVDMKRDITQRPMVSEHATQPSHRSIISKDDRYEEIFIERIAVNPRDIEAYEALGDYYVSRKNFEDAKDCYKQVLKLDPKSRGAKVRMRRLERFLANEVHLQ